MILPRAGDYIDIHNHGGIPSPGMFIVENLMAHEGRMPSETAGMAFSLGIHPWFLNETNISSLLSLVKEMAAGDTLIAIGEAGFDKLKGPSPEIQRKAFEEQAKIAEDVRKPLFIHCVRAWDELLLSHKTVKPHMPWIIHGFRGKKELARQLISRNMYLSFWFDFVIRPESSELIRSLPPEKIFLETDGSDVSIKEIYRKVAEDMGINVTDLITVIHKNFKVVFNNNEPT
jgi:TatD DNase family protein